MVSNHTCARILSAALLACGLAAEAAEPSSAPAFVTWPTLEPDKCASIWLIRRFVSPAAPILFYEPDTQAPAGIPFDTPDAELRRYHNASTFETMARHYRIADARVGYVGRLMHDIEINIWERKALPETREIAAELNDSLARTGTEGAIAFCTDFFDRLTRAIPNAGMRRGAPLALTPPAGQPHLYRMLPPVVDQLDDRALARDTVERDARRFRPGG